MNYKKATILGMTIVMTAAMVIFAQEPLRKKSSPNDGVLREAAPQNASEAADQVSFESTAEEQSLLLLGDDTSDDFSQRDDKPVRELDPLNLELPLLEETETGQQADEADSSSVDVDALVESIDAELRRLEPPVPAAAEEVPGEVPVESEQISETTDDALDFAAEAEEPADDTFDFTSEEPTAADESPELIVLEEESTLDELPTLETDEVEPASPETLESEASPEAGQDDFTMDLAAVQDLSTDRRSAAVSIDWKTPRAVNVGQETQCSLVVRNRGQSPSVDTVVRVAFSGEVQVVAADPVPEQGGEQLLWNLGTLEPGEQRDFRIGLVPQGSDDLVPVAKVTSSTVAYGRIQVQDPKLDLNLTSGTTAIVGDVFACSAEVSNPGTGPAYGVVVETLLPEGLKHPKGKTLTYSIGTLLPGESRSVKILANAATAGEHVIAATAKTTASNPNVLTVATLEAKAETVVEIIEPALNVAVNGPRLRYLDRQAVYTIEVANPGTMPANNVRVAEVIPAGLEFVEATSGAVHNPATRSVDWFVGQLEPGATAQVQVKLLATELGEQTLAVSAQAERGVRAEAKTVTVVEGIAALLLKVVDVDDPIEVGSETVYEIRVLNQGTKSATDVQVIVEIPEGMEPLKASGPTRFRTEGRQIHFGAIPRIGPRADAVYRVTVRGTEQGDLRFRAWLKGGELSTPVLQEESTRVYGD